QVELDKLEKQDTRTEAFNDLQRKYQQIMDQRAKLREEQLMLQNKIELAKHRQTEVPLPMPVAQIIQRLKEIDKLEAKLLQNLNSREPAKLAQAIEDGHELGRLLRELIAKLESPEIKQNVAVKLDPTLIKDLEAATKDLREMEVRLATAQAELKKFNQTEQQQKGSFFELQRKFQKHQAEYNTAAGQVSELRVEQAKLEAHQQDLEHEIKDELGGTDWLQAAQAQKTDTAELKSTISKLKHQLELIGGIDPEAVKEYEETKTRHDFLAGQAEDLRRSIKSLEKVITELDDKIQVQFDTTFKHINTSFQKFFKILFDGGKAELKLIKEDPEEQAKKEALAKAQAATAVGGLDEATVEADQVNAESSSILDKLMAGEEQISPKKFLKKRTGKVVTGIDIMATPPGKKVSTITMLSGGERSLASIALICAVISSTPPPFVILDEVDAALDEANSQRFAKILNELAHQTQFIVITHNRATMHVANILYGVTMTKDGTSKLLSLKFEEAAQIVRQ
ncbi:MAG TPA: hypothetical protein VGA08_03105, partial [Candidatus Saccharimonadales bacterium]